MKEPSRPELDFIEPIESAMNAVEKVAQSSEARKLPHEFIERLWTIAIAAIGLIAAFAWDRFLRELIDQLFAKGESLWMLFAYAVLMTFIAAFVAINLPWVERWYRKHIRKNDKDKDVDTHAHPHIPVGKNLK